MDKYNNTHQKPANYALNGKIMLCSVIILFVVVFAVACFHSSLRLCFLRRRHRHRRRQPIFITTIKTNSGLDVSILKTLPTFVHSATIRHVAPLECAICLSEFEDGEMGRVLPNCKHVFHVECIDRWFESNSNCTLCRCHVTIPTSPEVVITVSEDGGSDEEDDVMGSPAGRRPVDLVEMGMMGDGDFRWQKSNYGGEGDGNNNNRIESLKSI